LGSRRFSMSCVVQYMGTGSFRRGGGRRGVWAAARRGADRRRTGHGNGARATRPIPAMAQRGTRGIRKRRGNEFALAKTGRAESPTPLQPGASERQRAMPQVVVHLKIRRCHASCFFRSVTAPDANHNTSNAKFIDRPICR